MTGHLGEGSARTGHMGLHTDLYELRMVDSYIHRGMTAPATFSLFVRPAAARPWYVAYGVERVLELVDAFTFGDEELTELERLGISLAAREAITDMGGRGEIRAVPDGTVVLAQEPLLEITAPLPYAQLLETAVMNLVQYPTLVATKAARCRLAAGDRGLADFGFRRAHGLETGVEAARAAYVGGGFATSNVEAGRRHGVPTTGTMAHSYIQAFRDEQEAFTSFLADNPEHGVLLVDTYDSIEGVRRAIAACRERGTAPLGVRLDSGDLGALAHQARGLLDEAGYTESQVIASGGLDEHRIHALVTDGAPIDAFGVGTALTVSQDHPALDIVYKLVEYDGRAVAKFSGAKSTFPGRKQVFRTGESPVEDVLSTADDTLPGTGLLRDVWRDGERLAAPTALEDVRARIEAGLATLPDAWRTPPYPDEAPLPQHGDALRTLTDQVRDAAF